MAIKKRVNKKKPASKVELSSLSDDVRQDLTLWSEAMLHHIKDIFPSYEDYKTFKLMALAEFQDMTKSRNPSLRRVIPERVKVTFTQKVKAIQVYFPRYTGFIVIEHPAGKLTIKQRSIIRHKYNILYGPLVKVNEDVMGDAWAIKMKILGKRKNPSRKTKDRRGKR